MCRFAVVTALVAVGLAAGCGSGNGKSVGVEDVGQKETPAPMAKSIAPAKNAILVFAAVVNDGEIVNDDIFYITLSRSVAGRPLEFKWAGTTDATLGIASFWVTDPKNVAGYYVARVFRGRSYGVDYTVPVGEWRSIPINASGEGGASLFLELGVGGKPRVGRAFEMFKLPRRVEIKVTSPRDGDGERFDQYSVVRIGWSGKGFDLSMPCRLDLYTGDGAWFRHLGEAFLGADGFQWPVVDVPPGVYFIRVSTYIPPVVEGWSGQFDIVRVEPVATDG